MTLLFLKLRMDNLTRNEVTPRNSVRKQTINCEFSYVTIWRLHIDVMQF